MTGGLVLWARAATGAILLTSVISKIRSRAAVRDFLDWLRSLPLGARTPIVAAGMVAAETTALGLLVPSGTAGLGLALSAVIVWVYGVAIARLSSAGIRVPCRCFGTAGRPLGSVHIVRNGLIGLIATAAAVLVVMGQGPMPPMIVRVSS